MRLPCQRFSLASPSCVRFDNLPTYYYGNLYHITLLAPPASKAHALSCAWQVTSRAACVAYANIQPCGYAAGTNARLV